MRIPLAATMARLPLPATEEWPRGGWDTEPFRHGSMSLVLFTPRGHDYQSPHEQDELYIVMRGTGELVLEDEHIPFVAGDVLFVPARRRHRFERFSDDLVTWAVFWGPPGGE
jgi:mannose-6-phosphate isomerase-like protein (cupin superfamily)